MQRGGSTKRKAQEMNDGGTQIKSDVGWGPSDIGTQHYLQETRSSPYNACSEYGDLHLIARQRNDMSVNIIRKHVEFPADINPKEGGFFPKLRKQVQELQNDISYKAHSTAQSCRSFLRSSTR